MDQPLRILYVDDSAFDRELVRDSLAQERDAFHLTVATNRLEFERLLPQGPWDLVLSDFNILGFEGLQVLDAVKSMDSELPVVIVTGTGSEEVAVEAMKRGASDYTIKTNQHLQRLPITIRQALKHHQVAVERDRLFNLSADLLSVVGADGRLAQVNPAWTQCLGWSTEELIGKSPVELVHDDDREALLQARASLALGEPLRNLENRYRCKDGSYRWLSWNSQPLVESGLVFAGARDVTEAHERDTQLRLLETCIERLNDVVLVTEASPLAEPGPRIIFVNSAFEELTGYSQAEVIGKSPRMLQGDHTDRAELDRIKSALSLGEPVRAELINYTKAGAEYWIELDMVPVRSAQGHVTHFVAVERDITERRRTQEALRLSELEHRQLAERLTTAQAVARVGSWETDLTTFEVIWTGEVHRIFGTDPWTFKPTHPDFLERVHPEDRETVNQALLDSIGKGGPCSVEHRVLLPDGATKIVEERWRVLLDEGGQPLRAVGTCQDITERKREEQTQTALHLISEAAHSVATLPDLFRRIHEILSGLLPARNFFVALHDELTGDLDFPYFVDERDPAPVGRKLDDGTLSGQVIRTGRSVLLTQEKRLLEGVPVVGTEALEWLGVPLKSGSRVIGALVVQSYTGDVRFTSKDQALLEFVSGQAAAAIDRKRAEQELRYQNDLFRLVQRATNDLVYVRDIARGTMEWSDAAEAVLGYAREDVVPTFLWCRDKLHPEDRDRVVRGIEEVISEGGSSWSDKYRIQRKDGAYVQVLDRSYVVRDAAGRATQVVGAISDLSLLMRAEEAMAANQAKSDFLATMTHEIRTPMIGMLGMVEILSHSQLDEDQQRVLGVVQSSARSLLRIIGDILDFSKIEAGRLALEPQAVSLRGILEEEFATFSGAASGKGLSMSCEVDSKIAAAHLADPVRFREIITNFLSNSLKFTQEGSVGIQAELLSATEEIQTLAFRVRDTGIGVSAENQKRLFQPFVQAESTTTRRFGGTGLGLSICVRLAQMMGGGITMESEEGKGTTMSFVAPFPVADTAALIAPAGTPFEPMDPPSRDVALAAGCLVLLVEDHPTNRIVLMRQLHLAGYQADAAEDGLLALEAWRQHRYGLVLTDVHMPRMDGYSLAAEIRRVEESENLARTPILALTANALQGEKERCRAAGMDDCLIKPVDIPELDAKLRQWLPLASKLGEPRSGKKGSFATNETVQVDFGILDGFSGGDRSEAMDILQDFRDSAVSDIAILRTEMANGNREAIIRQAHRIKGASGTIGARPLAEAAAAFEAQACIQEAPLEDTFRALEAAFARFDHFVKEASTDS